MGELGELEIPPGLTALIASRLDALAPDERRLVKECSVLGGSFSRQSIEGVSDTDPAFLDDLLGWLSSKGGAHCPGRQAFSRTWAIRLHSVAHEIGRLRHADQG